MRFADASHFAVSPDTRLNFLMALLRVVLYVAAALGAINYSERIVSWFARDWIPQQPPS
jgi:hypothetical protein